MQINDFFDEVYCIGLERREDRWSQVSNQLKKHNIKAKRVPAIDGNTLYNEVTKSMWPHTANEKGVKHVKVGDRIDFKSWGAVGLSMTWRLLLKKIKEKNLGSVLILEDDAYFVDDFQERFSELSRGIPEDWDMLYLGGNNIELGLGEQVADRLFRCKFTQAAHAVGINGRIVDEVLERNDVEGDFIDCVLARMHDNCKAYVFSPFLVTQRESFSDIENKHGNYQHLIK